MLIQTKSSALAEEFDLEHHGEIQVISGFSLPGNAKPGAVLWTKTTEIFDSVSKGVLIAPAEFRYREKHSEVTYLFSEKSPRLIFAKILAEYFAHLIHDDFNNCVIQHRANSKIKIGDNVFIAENVKIGDGTIIHHNVCIYGGSKIGENCVIGANSSISTVGMGLEYDGGEIISFPQLGGVNLEDGVEIGPQSTVRRGAIVDTIIKSEAKIGAFCNIGHNSIIGSQSILTCNIVIGGSAQIGFRNYIGVGASIKNKVLTGDNVTVAMGAVVVSNIPEGQTVMGVPAKIK